MGTAALDRKSQSIFALQFDIAWRRIWSGRGIRFAVTVEILLWCVVAVEFGLFLFNLTDRIIDEILLNTSIPLYLVLTPIIILIGIFKTVISTGAGDSSLRTVPLTSFQVLIPRLVAILLTLARFIVPILVLFLLTTLVHINYTSYQVKYPWLSTVIYNLFWHNKIGDTRLLGTLELNRLQRKSFILAAELQAIGWATLPLTWGLFWGLKLKDHAWAFMVVYVLWLVFPLLQALVVYMELIKAPIQLLWTVTLMSGLTNNILSLVFLLLALNEWRRRSG